MVPGTLMLRLLNVATPVLAVVRDSVPLRVPPFRKDSVTVVLLSTLLKASAILTATAGVNTAPALVTDGASCWKLMAYGVGRMTSDRLAEASPSDDAVRVLLPALVITRSLKVAEPFTSELIGVVPLAKVPVAKPIVIGTPLDETLLLN